MYLLHDGLGIGSSVLQRELILTNFICKMNFQPVKAIFAKRLSVGKLEKTSVDIGTHVIKVRRDGIHTTTEVHVVWEVNLVNVLETHGDRKSEKELATQGMSLTVLLMLFQKLQLFSKVGQLDHLWGYLTLIKALGDLTEAATYGPDILNNLQDTTVNPPFNLPEDIEDLTHIRHI